MALPCSVLWYGAAPCKAAKPCGTGADGGLPTLTEEDLQNLQLAGACGVTGVMLPFVRGLRTSAPCAGR